nr:LAGLIDADG endonuclease [Trametes cingulata]
MIPSYSRKAISGQNNYLGMVTSHKMIENEMGYRGSKSEILINSVKEQRVDGSYFGINPKLRYTLMGGESRYQIKVPSKQLKKIFFSSSAYAQVQLTKLDPWFVTGFCDGEACFSVSIYIDKRIKGRVARVVKPSFQISLHSRDVNLLLQLQEFFACGNIVCKNNRSEKSFRVNSLHDLTNFIIPHFINFPLLSQKAADFELFKQIVNLINTKVHLTDVGLLQIINIRASMNLGLSDLQKSEFINYKPVPRPIIKYTEIPNPNWIAGFSSAEGCFLVTISKSNKNKVSQIVQLTFKISQHHRDKILLGLITKYFNCGAVYYHSENAFVFKVGKFVDINNKIIPFFKAHSIQGIKQLDYQDFCEIATLIGEGKHLSPIGIAKIQLIKDRMNTKRN